MTGRKPVPTALKVLRGNPGRRPLNLNEPKPEPLELTTPEELEGDPVARAEWLRTIAPAIRIGHITGADRSMAIAHCELWSTWRSQVAEAAHQGHVIEVGPNDYPTPNPARSMANKTFQLLVRVDAELGLTPTSRSRVTVASKKEPSDPDEARFFGSRKRA
jgi:P27 family predicted phage terminase small subunit